jgi:hypothetical protein
MLPDSLTTTPLHLLLRLCCAHYRGIIMIVLPRWQRNAYATMQNAVAHQIAWSARGALVLGEPVT